MSSALSAALAVLSVLLGLVPAGAGEVRTGLAFASAALAGDMRYSIYLPDAYGLEPERRFPVVYLLHGYGANEREWIERGEAAAALDALIAGGEVPPLIAVMPYAAKSWYADSAAYGGPGDYETAIVSDLPAHVEASYRAKGGRRDRVIAGLSMGGYGALRLAFFHPGRYLAAASLSGALYEQAGVPGEAPGVISQDAAERWYLGAFGRPFDPAAYRRLSPFSRLEALAALDDPPAVMITAGDDDYFGFYEGAADLYAAMRRAGLKAELRIEDGGHDWELWRKQFPHVMRFFAKIMARAEN